MAGLWRGLPPATPSGVITGSIAMQAYVGPNSTASVIHTPVALNAPAVSRMNANVMPKTTMLQPMKRP